MEPLITKPWYASRTIWAALISGILGLTGIVIPETDTLAYADLACQIAAVAAAGYAIYARKTATVAIAPVLNPPA